MTPSKALFDLLDSIEGFKANAYPDPGSKDGNPWTIGYGTTHYPTGASVKKGDVCTREQADAYQLAELNNSTIPTIGKLVTVPLTQNQFDALCSFVYNCGTQNFKTSTLLKKLNAGDYQGAADQMRLWIHNDGKILNGLVSRREKERNLFLSP